MKGTGFKTLAKRGYAKLPPLLRSWTVAGYIRYKLLRDKRLQTPTVLTFFITSRCNNRCSHCFYWQDLDNGADELTLEEIGVIAASLRHPVHLSLTGGEPFLRQDVAEICRIFQERNNCRMISLATNGYNTDRSVAACGEILQLPLEALSVQVSLDGLEETHNRIRGVKDGFQRAMTTILALQHLATQDSRFSVTISMTVQRMNISEVEDLVEYLLPLAIPMRFALVRGQHFGTYGLPAEVANEIDPAENDAPIRDLALLESLFKRLNARNSSAPYPFLSERQQELIRMSLKMMTEHKRILPCHAGIVEGVLYANGNVALCELTRPIGNIRDFGFDFTRLWQSAMAEQMRIGIRNCFCIHGCNLSTSLMYKPDMVMSALDEMTMELGQTGTPKRT
jgi:MoaA/NifB/PqqE/SkfB family radical SAM enzyme